jgi:TRAP-type C4-dicarboxylate transport system substrate-binding protein
MRIFSTALTASAVALVTAGGAWAQEYTFKLHHLLPAAAPPHVTMLEPWARQVEENSGGQVKIEIYPAMTLGGKPPELVQQARDGVVDLIWTLNGYTPGLFPRTEVFELPNVFTGNARATNLAMQEMFAEDLAEEYQGLEVMFLHVHAGQAIQMADRPVHTPADLAGTQLRIPTRTGAWVIEALGAAPVAMPVPDLPQAFSKGVVDGALIPFEVMLPLKLQEQTKVHVEGADGYRLGTSTFQVSMNKARWDSLPPEIQQAFRDASGPEWVAEIGDIWRANDDHALEVIREAGNEVILLNDEEVAAFKEAVNPVVDRWIEEVTAQGIDGAGLVERANELTAKHTDGGA